MLSVNQLFEWHNHEKTVPQIDRILWIDSSGTDAVTININDPFAQPIWHKYEHLLTALTTNQISLVASDPYTVNQLGEEGISPAQRQLLDKAWAAIAPIIASGEKAFESRERGRLVTQAVKQTGRSETTIRKDLRRYWQGGQNINALLPRFNLCGGKGKVRQNHGSKRGRPTLLSQPTGESIGINVDAQVREKLITGCRLFYENRTGRTLKQAYQLTLEKFFHRGYTIEQGVLIPIMPPAEELPSFTQFKYWYHKSSQLSQTLIARSGQRQFNLHHRAVGGDSTAMAFGPGSLYQIDATIADVYLVSSLNRNWIIGRPTLYLVIDVFSRLITGFVVTLEPPSWLGAMLSLENATANKVEFCRLYGIEISETEWPSHHLPEAILADRGELEGYNANNLVESLSIKICNTPPYRADLKGIIERSFRYFNDEIIHWLPGNCSHADVPGQRDYRLDGVLTLQEFRHLMILFILNHNQERRLDEYNFEEFMIQENVAPYPVDLWHWGVENRVGSLHWQSPQIIRLNLLPSESASVTRNGIYFKKLHYTCELALQEQWFVKARNSGAWNSRYDGVNSTSTQLVWLKLECPCDGSVKGLCLNFFQAVDDCLGTSYYESYGGRGRRTLNELMPDVARVASLVHLGVLVIDEIQVLSKLRSGGHEKMLDFFVQLINLIGLPVVLVGTYKAWPVIGSEFRQIRRGTGQGDLVWEQMKVDDDWQLFVESLWQYQYIQFPCPLTEQLNHTLYYESQGITDLAVKLFLLAQVRAITTGKEKLTKGIIQSVALDYFRTAREVLNALKSGSLERLKNCEDVRSINIEPFIEQELGYLKVTDFISPKNDVVVEPSSPLSSEPQPKMEPVSGSNSPLTKTSKKPKKPPKATSSDGLPEVVVQGTSSGMSAYQTLKQKGYIGDTTEFISESEGFV